MAAIAIPHTLKNYNVFVDGVGYAGRIDEAVLPKITVKTEEHLAGGMDAPVKMDMGLEGLEMELTFAEMTPDILKNVAVFNDGQTPITIRAALHDDVSPDSVWRVVVNARGTLTESDSGSMKVGDKTQQKYVMSLRYYKLTIDGEIIFEIDLMNLKRVVGGVDQTESIRAAIGL